MKLNKLALAVVATASVSATAGVTVSPLLLGYHYTNQAHKAQRDVLLTGRQTNEAVTDRELKRPNNGGVAQLSGLYTGAAIGVELTPSTQVQVEYGVSNGDARSSKSSWDANPANRFDAEQQTLAANLLIGTEQFTGYNPDTNFKPYVLVGGGQSHIKVQNQTAYNLDGDHEYTGKKKGDNIAAGTVVAERKDKIANVGLGARYLVNDALALRGEARATHNFDAKWWEGLAMAGLEVTLGGRLTPKVPVPPVAEPVVEPAPVVTPVVPVVTPVVQQPVIIQEEKPAVVDSDRDGVPDHLDVCPSTARNLVVDARGCPVQETVQENLRQELRIFFDNNKSVIKPQYRTEVAKVADAMREYPNATATIEGHASKTGSAKYNQRLSEARANAVKSMLSNEFGIAPNRLTAVGYGYDRPIAPNNTEEGRALNRRVYAVIEGSKTSTVNKTK